MFCSLYIISFSLQKYCGEYVKWVEEALAEALTTYQKPTDEDGGYVRQSSVKYVNLYPITFSIYSRHLPVDEHLTKHHMKCL
jgi:hypothetical protein